MTQSDLTWTWNDLSLPGGHFPGVELRPESTHDSHSTVGMLHLEGFLLVCPNINNPKQFAVTYSSFWKSATGKLEVFRSSFHIWCHIAHISNIIINLSWFGSEVGGVRPTGKSFRVVPCVRACVRAVWLPGGIQLQMLRQQFSLFPFPPAGGFPFSLETPPPPNLLSNFSWPYRYVYRIKCLWIFMNMVF